MTFLSDIQTRLKSMFVDESTSVARANALLNDMRAALRRYITNEERGNALQVAQSIIRIGWWSLASARFDTELDKQVHQIGRSMARDCKNSDRSKVLYITSGILPFGGISQQLLNHLEYHDHESFEIHVFSTEQYHGSDLSSSRAKRIKELCHFRSVVNAADKMACISEIADYTEQNEIGIIILLLSPDDVIGLVVPSMFNIIPSIFINASHHVFTGGSFQFDAFVDVTGHYHQESVSSRRNKELHSISLGGRIEFDKVEAIPARDLKRELDLGHESILTVTVGNPSKSTWAGDDSYSTIIKTILEQHGKVHHLILASNGEKLKQIIIGKEQKYSQRIHSISPTQNIISFLKGCDIYLNSFPMGGALSTLDAIVSGLPVVFIKAHKAWFRLDELTACTSDEYLQIVHRYLDYPMFRDKAMALQKEKYISELSPDMTIRKYEGLLRSVVSTTHKEPYGESSMSVLGARVGNYDERINGLQQSFESLSRGTSLKQAMQK